MSGLFSNDGTGWVHDCDEPARPTEGASFTCPECEVTWFTALGFDSKRWVWVSSKTGRAKN